MKTSVYIYPNYNPKKDKSGNLYIKFFKDSFVAEPHVIVRDNLWEIGVASAFFNLRSNIFIFHWVDLIPFKKFGRIQFIIFRFLIFVLKKLNKKIVWVLHNKRAHRALNKLVDKGMGIMAKNSDLVITHSSEGVDFFKTQLSQKTKIIHIPHPVYSSIIFPTKEIKWDYIIWGGISEHKRIVEFLEYIKDNLFFRNKKILICGKCSSDEYNKTILNLITDNIDYYNRFITDEELHDLILQSKSILFTYSPNSILSSGAFIYSLNFNKRIIAPKVGNFIDMKEIVDCFEIFSDIEKFQIDEPQNIEYIQSYLKENTWEKLPKKIF